MAKATINWTTDDKLLQLLATGIEHLDQGDSGTGRAYLGAMGKGLGFRSLKLREKTQNKKK